MKKQTALKSQSVSTAKMRAMKSERQEDETVTEEDDDEPAPIVKKGPKKAARKSYMGQPGMGKSAS
jgi:hypothetical protein